MLVATFSLKYETGKDPNRTEGTHSWQKPIFIYVSFFRRSGGSSGFNVFNKDRKNKNKADDTLSNEVH